MLTMKKVYLDKLDNKLIVRYKHNKKSDRKRISLYPELADKQLKWKDDSTCIITIAASEKVLFMDKIKKQTDVKSCNPVYAINTGLEMGVTDEFLVKFNDNISQKKIQKLHKKYGVEVVKTTELYQLIKVPDGSDAMEIANVYQESGLTRFSHPNFISDIELHQVIPNDPYFINQFSLNNTGQVFTDGHWGTNDADIDAPEAWTITQGDNDIIIAVLDQGVTPNHPDLPNARQVRLNGSNFGDGDPNNPTPTGNGNHGNACAGIIAATQNNNQGISGIAPNCRIMPLRVHGATVQRTADAITFAWENGADILSCSWGYESTNANFQPVIRDAIINATTLGRNERGCIVVFSASNSADHAHNGDGEVRFPSNVDVAGVLTVGASERDDFQANYSPLSNPNSPNNQIIDLVAPSHRAYSCQIAGETFEAWSIDIPGNAGYNPVHNNDCGVLPGIGTVLPDAGVNNLSYTGRFGGTSYACPQVAAVAALMLSINPNLTQLQVFDILTTTADEVGGYAYNNGFSNELGNGRLNACSAVSQVVSTVASVNGSSLTCNSPSVYTINNLPADLTVSWTKSSNLTQIGGNTGTTYTVKAISSAQSGTGWVRATLNVGCGDVTMEKTFWVGLPSAVAISGPSELGTNTIGTYRSYDEAGKWRLWNIWQYMYVDWISPSPDVILNVCKFETKGIEGFITVVLERENTCGTKLSTKSVRIISGGGGGDPPRSPGSPYKVYPNPAVNTLTIEYDENITAEKLNSNETEIYLYDKFMKLYKHKKQHGLPITLNISDLKSDVYILRIMAGDQIYEEKIIVSEK